MSPTPSLGKTDSLAPTLIRSPQHYYSDGTFIFIVENVVFRVYRDLLGRRSEVLRDLFALPQLSEPGLKGQGEGFWEDGTPVITLHDKAADFTNLLDMLMPGSILGREQSPSFDELAGLVRICDKYIIDDVKNWALSWLDEVLPMEIDDIDKLETVYSDPTLIARVINFSQEFGLIQYLPLAYYSLSFFNWHKSNMEEFSQVYHSLSPWDHHRLQVGRLALQGHIFGRLSELPDMGKAPCTSSPVGGQPACSRARSATKPWIRPMEGFIHNPLQELHSHVKPQRELCYRCARESIEAYGLLRHDIFRELPRFFLLQ